MPSVEELAAALRAAKAIVTEARSSIVVAKAREAEAVVGFQRVTVGSGSPHPAASVAHLQRAFGNLSTAADPIAGLPVWGAPRGDSAFLGWNGQLYAVEPGRPVPDYIEVDMFAEIDRVDSFKVENNKGEIIDLSRHHMTVSREKAMIAVREYVSTGNRLVGLDWQQFPNPYVGPVFSISAADQDGGTGRQKTRTRPREKATSWR